MQHRFRFEVPFNFKPGESRGSPDNSVEMGISSTLHHHLHENSACVYIFNTSSIADVLPSYLPKKEEKKVQQINRYINCTKS